MTHRFILFYFFRFILEKERTEGSAEGEGENLQQDSPLSMEPDSELDLMTHEIMT